ncbi:carbohydrate kinase family protein [Trichothermofontia sp.]
MPYPQVLCLGEVLFDYLADIPLETLGKPPGEALSAITSWTAYAGGAPANVACGLVKLGTAAGFIGCVGTDVGGEVLVQILATTGVDLTGLQRHPQRPTRQVYVVRSATGERSFVGFSTDHSAAGGPARTAADFADAALQAEALPVALFAQAQYLVLGTLMLAYPDSRQAVQRALALAHTHQLTVVMDVNWRPQFWPDPQMAIPLIRTAIAQATFLKLADDEAQDLFQTTDPAAIASQFPNLHGVLATQGDRGCQYWIRGHQGHYPAFKVSVVDTTGAGDGFVAGFVHQLCQSQGECLATADRIQTTIAYANSVGALSTTQPGAIAAQPTAIAVQAFLQQRAQLL